MITHIVLWTLTDKAKADGVDFVLEKLRASAANMKAHIPGALNLEVHLNKADGPHDLVFYGAFDDEKALAAYGEHPLHRAHREMAKDWVCSRETVDF